LVKYGELGRKNVCRRSLAFVAASASAGSWSKISTSCASTTARVPIARPRLPAPMIVTSSSASELPRSTLFERAQQRLPVRRREQ
jgi:hypothetical protein